MTKALIKLVSASLRGLTITAIFTMLAHGLTSFAQTNIASFYSASDKIPPFLATAQLMDAILYNGTADDIRVLIEKGANVNAGNQDDWHPLQLAAKLGNITIVRALLEKGAAVDATNAFGANALHSAVFRGYLDIARLLLEKGAKVNARDNTLSTPLLFAASRDQTNLVMLLLEKGADINATNNFGDSPLLKAVEANQIDIVRLLLARGANVNLENDLGISAYDTAKVKGNSAVMELLRDAGAYKSSSAKRDENLKASLQRMAGADEALTKSLQNFPPAGTTVTSMTEKTAGSPPSFQNYTDTSGYVTNLDLLTPFTLTNSSGTVFTNAVLVKLTPNKFMYKTAGGAMGMMPLSSLPQEYLDKIGYDPQAAQAADEAEQQKKARIQEQARLQRAAQMADSGSQGQPGTSDVSRSIRSYAEKKWPNDYEMQKYEINTQTKAYNWVAGASSATGVPQSVFNQIKYNAIEKWPDQYDMQKYEMEQQVKAYTALH